MDLINGKTMYCPECGHHLAPHGKVNGITAHVKSYCPICDKHYHWVAYINKDKEHKVSMFSHFLKYDS